MANKRLRRRVVDERGQEWWEAVPQDIEVKDTVKLDEDEDEGGSDSPKASSPKGRKRTKIDYAGDKDTRSLIEKLTVPMSRPVRQARSPEDKIGLGENDAQDIIDYIASQEAQAGGRGPGGNIPVGAEQGPLLTDSTEEALTQIGRGTGAAIDEWDQRTSFAMPTVAGHESKDDPRFSPVAGTTKAFKGLFKGMSDAEMRTARDFLKNQNKKRGILDEAKAMDAANSPDPFDISRPFESTSFKSTRAPEVTDADFAKTLQAGEDVIKTPVAKRTMSDETIEDLVEKRYEDAYESAPNAEVFNFKDMKELNIAKKQLADINVNKQGLSETGVEKVRKVLEAQIKGLEAKK